MRRKSQGQRERLVAKLEYAEVQLENNLCIFRRTSRSHLAALGIDPVVAERCLNHRIKGVEGIYNRYQYFDERKQALELWADLLVSLERGEGYNVMPLKKVIA